MPRPQLERNIERFTQYPHAGRPDRAAGRRRRRGERGEGPSRPQARHDRHAEIARRDRRPRVRDLSHRRCMLLAAIGTAIGLVIGAALPFADRLGHSAPCMPLPIAPALHAGELALALLYGLLTALAFALWPLGRAHDVPVSALFRDEVAPRAPLAAHALRGRDRARRSPRWRRSRSRSPTTSASPRSSSRPRPRVFVLLRLVAALLMAAGAARCRARARPVAAARASPTSTGPGALTPSVVLSLGLGLALLVTVIADRRQPAPPVHRRAARQGAVVLSSSTSRPPTPTRFDAFVRAARAGRDARARADAARAHRRGERRARPRS